MSENREEKKEKRIEVRIKKINNKKA